MGEWMSRTLSPSITRLRCPWARHRNPHCSGCVFTVCVCSLLCVCTLNGINAEHKFRVWVIIHGCMSHHFHFHLIYCYTCFLYQLFHLRFKILCLQGYLQRQVFWQIQMCFFNHSTPIMWQKSVSLTAHAYRNEFSFAADCILMA